MSIGRPPSSRPSSGADPRLDAARGLVRDALGSLRNLEQLLKSIRVGPKALSAVIPDVHASCAPLLGAVRELLGAVREQLPGDRAPDALEAFIAPRVEALEQALAKGRREPLNAKNRLALEAVVARASSELDAARALMEMLEEALGGPALRVDLLELVRSAAQTSGRTESDEAAVQATLAAPPQGLELLVNPRLATWLLGVGAQLIGGQDLPPPHLTLIASGSRCGFRVQRGPGTGEALSLHARPLIAPTLECARTATLLSGAELDHEDATCTILWAAPPA